MSCLVKVVSSEALVVASVSTEIDVSDVVLSVGVVSLIKIMRYRYRYVKILIPPSIHTNLYYYK